MAKFRQILSHCSYNKTDVVGSTFERFENSFQSNFLAFQKLFELVLLSLLGFYSWLMDVFRRHLDTKKVSISNGYLCLKDTSLSLFKTRTIVIDLSLSLSQSHTLSVSHAKCYSPFAAQ